MGNNKKDDIFSTEEFLGLKSAQEKIERPDQFAEVFCAAAKTQTSVKDLLRELLQEIIATDPKARESLNGLIKEVFQQDWKAFVRSAWGKFALLSWTLVAAGIGAWVKTLFDK
ncbi:hypothetical protein COU74_03080 [Candidatus Peregrinibacteria bacterium CG10_big_fil_rev_8_21_14_0_10_36_19]|nr:MAG: hypothetical protein COU74_03080 [Candidatus Peregrinibacteria bacterium CG10_big_fil_rev_8_21_14_0_10_36_19]